MVLVIKLIISGPLHYRCRYSADLFENETVSSRLSGCDREICLADCIKIAKGAEKQLAGKVETAILIPPLANTGPL
jgi:hypothetical protein